MLYVYKMEVFVFCLTTSSLLSSHNRTGFTHSGFSVGTLGRRKLGANQVAPGRKSSFLWMCDCFPHSLPNTGAFHYRWTRTLLRLLISCIIAWFLLRISIKTQCSDESFINTNEGLYIVCESLQKRRVMEDLFNTFGYNVTM